MAFVNEVSEILGESRTVDYERGGILKAERVENLGYYRIPDAYPFVLLWKEKKIELLVNTSVQILKDDGSKAHVIHCVSKCHYPEDLRPYKRDIIQLVLDSLMAYGVNFGKDPGTKITVRIDPDLGNLQMGALY